MDTNDKLPRVFHRAPAPNCRCVLTPNPQPQRDAMESVLSLLLSLVNARDDLDNARIGSKLAPLEFDRSHFAARIPGLQDAFIKAEALLAEVETWQERLESVDRLKARIVELETWLEDRNRTIASLTEARK